MSTLSTTQPLGTVSKASDGSYTLRYERHLSHPITRVWQAITDPAQVANWFGKLQAPWQEGSAYYLKFYESADARAEGTVLKKQPETLLEFTWLSKGEPMHVRWELAENGPNATTLVLTHTDIKGGAQHYGSGWHVLLDKLIEVVDGTRTEYGMVPGEGGRLHDEYAALM